MKVLPALKIGLTGGIGSGKSTVARMLTTMGAALIDADAISRATTAAQGAAIDALEAVFGSTVLTPERALDRERMRALVFSDPAAKLQLERIVHPLVGQAIERQTQEAQASGHGCIVFDIPLLVESGRWRAQLHRVLVVDCSEETQVARVMERSGVDEDTVKRIIATQASRLRRLHGADYVLFNEGISLHALELQVRQFGTWFGL